MIYRTVGVVRKDIYQEMELGERGKWGVKQGFPQKMMPLFNRNQRRERMSVYAMSPVDCWMSTKACDVCVNNMETSEKALTLLITILSLETQKFFLAKTTIAYITLRAADISHKHVLYIQEKSRLTFHDPLRSYQE